MPLIKLNNRSIKDVTSLPFGVGNLIHIQSQTASNSASVSFTTGINSTYKEYQFWFYDIHCRTDNTRLTFNFSTDSGSNYNVTKTSTFHVAIHGESDTPTILEYNTGGDLAQSTGFQQITTEQGTGADESSGGSMNLFNPSSTIYVKHWVSNLSANDTDDRNRNYFTQGYGNTTSAINAIQFKMESGNFDGTIAMFGVL
jgi:hypothetical protein